MMMHFLNDKELEKTIFYVQSKARVLALQPLQAVSLCTLLCTQWHCHSVTGLGPLVPVKEMFKATAYKGMQDNCVLPTLWQQLLAIQCTLNNNAYFNCQKIFNI